MKAKTANYIKGLFDQAEAEFPDKSTEFLMEIVCQRAARTSGRILDHGDVAEALQQSP